MSQRAREQGRKGRRGPSRKERRAGDSEGKVRRGRRWGAKAMRGLELEAGVKRPGQALNSRL